MKLSEYWLREWVNPAIDSNMLSEQITMAGLQIEKIEHIDWCFTGVVVGKIIECYKHPNKDKLWVTKVDIGRKYFLNVVCGANNCRNNIIVAIATIGAQLKKKITIKAVKLYGKISEGKLCSFLDLSIYEEDNSKIIELPYNAPIGCDIRDYLQFYDCIIDINITKNRADCLCIRGIARDVAVLNKLDVKEIKIKKVNPIIKDTLKIIVDILTACPRYIGRIIKNIDVSIKTPLWIKEKLRRCGLRSVNVVVDITNYVLIELGQPMHTFDLDMINGCIEVRMAQHGETINILCNNKTLLTTDTLVIADKHKILAIAGIIGEKESSISLKTKNVFLSCAFFNPIAISCSARRYGINTESSHRYEYGVDPKIQNYAIERATKLILSICGGKSGPVSSSSIKLKKNIIIKLNRNSINRLMGYVIHDHEIISIITSIGCELIYNNTTILQVKVPSWRFDLKIEEDIVEEIARIYGYNNIPNIKVYTNIEINNTHECVLQLSRVKTMLVDRGYQEAITYSFVNPKIQNILHPEQTMVLLPNPISLEKSAMRLSLLSGIIETVVYNQNRQQQRIRLFESGFCFIPDKSAELGIRQELMLAGVITGPIFDEHWDIAIHTADFYDIKGDIEAILELTGKLEDINFKVALSNRVLHPGQSVFIYLHDDIIGSIGVLHPNIEAQLNLSGRTMVFELIWDKIKYYKAPKATDISRFPANRRDIALVVAENILAADIIYECKKVISNNLVRINLFDVYRGKGIAKGFKSVAISLILQNNTHTLEEEHINSTVSKCVNALKQRFKASLRN